MPDTQKPQLADRQFIDIWKAAVDQYQSDTKATLSATLKDATPDDVLALIDKRQKEFEAYRKQGRRVRNALEPILCLVRSFSETAATIISVVRIPTWIDSYVNSHVAGQPFPPAKAISAAVIVLLQVCVHVLFQSKMFVYEDPRSI